MSGYSLDNPGGSFVGLRLVKRTVGVVGQESVVGGDDLKIATEDDGRDDGRSRDFRGVSRSPGQT